jgi:hypothetical protein
MLSAAILVNADLERKKAPGGAFLSYVAARLGFEPRGQLAPPASLAGTCIKPLSHLATFRSFDPNLTTLTEVTVP